MPVRVDVLQPQPHLVGAGHLAQAGPARQRHPQLVTGQAVAESAVDRLLRGMQGRDWLAAIPNRLQMVGYHRPQHAAPAGVGVHPDPGQPGTLQPAAGDRQV